MTESLPSDAGGAPETEATAGTEQVQDVTSTPDSSSGDSGAKAPASVLDAVTAALKAEPGAGSSPTPENSDTNGEIKDPAEAEALPDRPTPEELNSYHSRTRRRVKQLLDRADKAESEMGTLKPLADQARKINDFVEQSGLDWSEVNAGFRIMQLMKSDPFAAREALAPMMEALNKACGVELPPDLHQKVGQGFIDEETARELAQVRQRARFATQANQQVVERVQQEQATQVRQRQAESVNSAIRTYQQDWQKSDPDHAAKIPLVEDKVYRALAGMAPEQLARVTPEAAVKLVEDARKSVEATFKPFARRTTPIAPLPGGTVSATAGAKPKSLTDAVAMALRA